MPVRDGARWIAEAIGSVLAQSFRDFELVIVDDGSVDGTPAIIDGFAARDPRVVVLRRAPSGVVASLNAGLAIARAPLIARLDADDIAEPQRFADQITAMQRDPDLVLLGSWATDINDEGRVIGTRQPETDPTELKNRFESGNPMIHPSVMFRTTAARAVGGYRAAFIAAEDYDLWLRLRSHGSIANLPQALIRYRVHPGSITSREPLQQMFSTRLALRSAELRHAGRPDPLEDHRRPVLMCDEVPEAYADLASLYCFLGQSDPRMALQQSEIPVLEKPDRIRLSRRERTLAQQALARRIACNPEAASAAQWWQLYKLRPTRALPLLWRTWAKSRTAGKF
jgi:GT2 family glycosyltransferase